jgi:hypothetical protein
MALEIILVQMVLSVALAVVERLGLLVALVVLAHQDKDLLAVMEIMLVFLVLAVAVAVQVQ